MSAVQFRPPAPRPSGSGTGGDRPSGLGTSGRAAFAPRPRTARRFASAIETPSRACGALRRVPIGSSCFCERGGAPLSHFPPGQAGSEPEVRCHCFFRGQGTPTSGRHRCAQRSNDGSLLSSRHAGQGTPTSGGTAARSAAADRSSLSRHAGQGTPTSVGTAARSAAKRRIAPLFHDTPGRERRPPVGTLRAAQQRRIAPLLHDTPGRERRPLASSPGGGRHRCAQRSEAADRSSLSRHAGQGTPTSGQFSRWGSAPLRAAQRGGVYHAAVRMTLNTEVPAEKGPPRTWGSFSAARLRRAVPTGGRRSRACAPLCLVAWAPRRAPPGTELSCPAGCAGGRDHERFSRWGSAPLRVAQRSGGSLLSFTTRRAGNADLRPVLPVGAGTAARSAAKGAYHAAVRMTLNTEVPAEKGPPRTWGSFSAARLRRAVPGPTGRTAQRSAFPCLRAALHGGLGAEMCTIPELHFHARRGVRADPIMWVSPGGGRHRCASGPRPRVQLTCVERVTVGAR